VRKMLGPRAITVVNCGQIRSALLSNRKTDPNVTLNMEGVEFLGSAGASMLFRVRQCLRRRGGDLVLEAVPSHIVEFLEATGYTEMLDP